MKKFRGCEIKVHQLTPTEVIIAKQGYGDRGYGGKDWAAYTGTVSSYPPTEEEIERILGYGNKAGRSLAEELFPDFAKKYYWRS